MTESHEPIRGAGADRGTAAAIEFDRVGFAFEGSGRPVLEDISLRVEPG